MRSKDKERIELRAIYVMHVIFWKVYPKVSSIKLLLKLYNLGKDASWTSWKNVRKGDLIKAYRSYLVAVMLAPTINTDFKRTENCKRKKEKKKWMIKIECLYIMDTRQGAQPNSSSGWVARSVSTLFSEHKHAFSWQNLSLYIDDFITNQDL